MSKRKSAASPEMSTPDPAKRRKRNDDTFFVDEETVETTKETGAKILRLLKKSTDKTGREIAGHFLELPSKTEYPQYYQQVKMPLSLNSIEKKLQAGRYHSMEQLESDLKRLVQNAKDFNSTKSEVYEDAERIRKALSNFMPKHNPAYQNPDYRAYPTPIPQELLDKDEATPEVNGHPESLKLKFTNMGRARRKSQAVSEEPDATEVDSDEVQNAQLELLDELTEQPDAINFYEKPSRRDYPDYYRMIKKPTAILDVRKLVERGKINDWDHFASEVRQIWDNAQDYNEDGSDIFKMAETLSAWSETQMQKHGVKPRPSLKLNLNAPQPPLKIRLSTSRSTPNPVGGVVDNESLRRQQEEMDHALGRAKGASTRPVLANGSIPTTAAPPSHKRSASTFDAPDNVNGSANLAVKQDTGQVPVEERKLPSAAVTLPRHLPTPAVEGIPPQMQNGHAHINGTQQSNHPPVAVQSTYRNPFAESDNPIERKFRDPGKGLQDALLASVEYRTHPKLNNDPKWKILRYASSTKTQTSSYIYLPSDHYYLRVTPALTEECMSRKRYKLCVARNWEVMLPSQEYPGVYDFRIHPGMNEIVVDVIADLAEGETKSYAPPQLQVDFERITFYVILADPLNDQI